MVSLSCQGSVSPIIILRGRGMDTSTSILDSPPDSTLPCYSMQHADTKPQTERHTNSLLRDLTCEISTLDRHFSLAWERWKDTLYILPVGKFIGTKMPAMQSSQGAKSFLDGGYLIGARARLLLGYRGLGVGFVMGQDQSDWRHSHRLIALGNTLILEIRCDCMSWSLFFPVLWPIYQVRCTSLTNYSCVGIPMHHTQFQL